jgi:two-component system sensor histidine kinase/response regulator
MGPDTLAAAMRERTANRSPVLMLLTGIAEAAGPDRLAKRGFDGQIPRPVRQSELFDTIMDAVARAGSSDYVHEYLDSAEAAPINIGRGARILVVEDNEVNQMVVTEILTGAGFACECAPNGRKAVEAVTRSHYDVVLMDCQMPEMDGFEATRAIRRYETQGRLPARANRLPIVALTANALKGDRERCLEAGMDDHLSKPLQPEKLLATIQSFLTPASAAPADGVPPAAKVETRAGAGSFDVGPLLRQCRGNHEFVEKVLSKFRNESIQTLGALIEGLKVGDGELAVRSAHSLKGMAATVSANSVSRVAAELEAQSELDVCLASIPTRVESQNVANGARGESNVIGRRTCGF